MWFLRTRGSSLINASVEELKPFTVKVACNLLLLPYPQKLFDIAGRVDRKARRQCSSSARSAQGLRTAQPDRYPWVLGITG